jgi:hypothetical protein
MKFKQSPTLLLLVLGAFLMLIDTLLAWQSINVGGLSYSRNAWHGFFGVVLGLLSVAFFLNALVQGGIVESRYRLPHRHLAVVLAPAILVFALIKNIDDSHSAWASYVGIVVAAAITYAAIQAWKAPPEPAATEAAAPAAPAALPPSGESPASAPVEAPPKPDAG